MCVDTLFLLSRVTEVLFTTATEKVWPTYLVKSFLSPFFSKSLQAGEEEWEGDKDGESSAVKMERS